MSRALGFVILVLLVVSSTAVASSAADAPTAAPRTWTLDDVRLQAGERVSIGFHPDLARAQVRATGGAFEVCQAVMDGTAGGAPGQSWPPASSFTTCIRSDRAGRALLPSVGNPLFHVAFLVRGVDDTAVRFSKLRVRYVPTDGFFAFAVPTATARFSVVPREDPVITVQPVPRTPAALPSGVAVRVTQEDRPVRRIEASGGHGASTRGYGPVQPDRPVVVRIDRPRDADLAYVVSWA